MKHYKNKYQPSPGNDVFLNGKYVGEAKEINIEYEPYEVWHDTYIQPVTITDMGKSTIEVVFDGGTLEYDSQVAETVMSHKDKKCTKIAVATKNDDYKGFAWYDNNSKWFAEAFKKVQFLPTWDHVGFPTEGDYLEGTGKYSYEDDLKSVKVSEYSPHYYHFHMPFVDTGMVGNYRAPEVDKLPGLRETVKNPVTGYRGTLERTIIRLNDFHKWSREQIADWLETLDVDITFKVDVNEQD